MEQTRQQDTRTWNISTGFVAKAPTETTRIMAKTTKITTKQPDYPKEITINFIAKEIWMPFKFVSHKGMVKEKVLIDSGANKNCMDIRTAQKLGVKPRLLDWPIGICNVDGTENCIGWIKHWLPITIFQGDKAHMLTFLIVDLEQDRLIFGYPWFQKFNLDINWPRKLIKGPPFLVTDATIDLTELMQHTQKYTRQQHLNPNGRALITTMQTHTDYQLPDDSFLETAKEQQAHYVTQTQFQPITPPLSPPLDKLKKLKEENYKQCLETCISCLEECIQWTTTMMDIPTNYPLILEPSKPILYPTSPATPPQTPPLRTCEFVHKLDINQTTAATQWAIDATKPKKTEELP
jgi:Aspartyl protease